MAFGRRMRDELRAIADERRAEKAERRDKVVRLHGEGLTPKMIAERLRMAVPTIRRLIRDAGGEPLKAAQAADYVFGDSV